MKAPRIAIPEPNFADKEYSERSWPQYARAVEYAGGVPVKVPLRDSPAKVAQLVASCEGVLLPGSPADVNPQKYGEEAEADCAAADAAREAVDELLLQDASNHGSAHDRGGSAIAVTAHSGAGNEDHADGE